MSSMYAYVEDDYVDEGYVLGDISQIIPDYGATVSYDQRISTYTVNNFSQRDEDGINITVRKWQVAFTDTPSNIQNIVNELTALKGCIPFTWYPPTGASGNWLCESFDVADNNFSQSVLSTVFEETFL